MATVIPTRAALLATRLAELTDWYLVIVCPCRGHPASVAVADLAAVRGGLPRLGHIVARLRCQRCGKPPSGVQACPGDPWHRRSWRVELAASAPGAGVRSPLK